MWLGPFSQSRHSKSKVLDWETAISRFDLIHPEQGTPITLSKSDFACPEQTKRFDHFD